MRPSRRLSGQASYLAGIFHPIDDTDVRFFGEDGGAREAGHTPYAALFATAVYH